MPGPESELLIHRNVFDAWRESEKPRETCVPALEAGHDRFHEPLAHTRIPEVWPHGERTEETDAAPIRSEVAPRQATVHFRRERGLWICTPSRADEIRVAHELRRV